ncbi:MAG: hypothetical protein Q8Q14_04735 [Gemmatimonadales bacterium]|nr:hypothetical protein [Gemmatimonadales bacterium]
MNHMQMAARANAAADAGADATSGLDVTIGRLVEERPIDGFMAATLWLAYGRAVNVVTTAYQRAGDVPTPESAALVSECLARFADDVAATVRRIAGAQ